MHIHSNTPTDMHAHTHTHNSNNHTSTGYPSPSLFLFSTLLPYLTLYCSWRHQSKDYLDQSLLPAAMNHHSACPTLPLRLRSKVQT